VFTLAGSFVPPPGLSGLVGEEIVLDLISQSATLPDWWQFKNGALPHNRNVRERRFRGGPFLPTTGPGRRRRDRRVQWGPPSGPPTPEHGRS
jgi:hypothetical protein